MGDAKKKNPQEKNPMIKWFVVHVIVVAALAAGLFALTRMPEMPESETVGNDTVVYLVRHAEKITGEDAGSDPALTAGGKARAETLAGLLHDKNITKIYASDYIRTRDTAAPTAKMVGLDIAIYNPRDLETLAQIIKDHNGRYLVVGHSNTIRATAIALGADITDAPVYEKTEYDRLYTVTLKPGGEVSSRLTRYGARYVPRGQEDTE